MLSLWQNPIEGWAVSYTAHRGRSRSGSSPECILRGLPYTAGSLSISTFALRELVKPLHHPSRAFNPIKPTADSTGTQHSEDSRPTRVCRPKAECGERQSAFSPTADGRGREWFGGGSSLASRSIVSYGSLNCCIWLAQLLYITR